MLNFEEELKKFKPSLEIENIEDTIEIEDNVTDQQDEICETMQKSK